MLSLPRPELVSVSFWVAKTTLVLGSYLLPAVRKIHFVSGSCEGADGRHEV